MPDKRTPRIIGVDRVDKNAVLVEYSDNTTAVYTQDQLATIKPKHVVVTDDEREEDNRGSG